MSAEYGTLKVMVGCAGPGSPARGFRARGGDAGAGVRAEAAVTRLHVFVNGMLKYQMVIFK